MDCTSDLAPGSATAAASVSSSLTKCACSRTRDGRTCRKAESLKSTNPVGNGPKWRMPARCFCNHKPKASVASSSACAIERRRSRAGRSLGSAQNGAFRTYWSRDRLSRRTHSCSRSCVAASIRLDHLLLAASWAQSWTDPCSGICLGPFPELYLVSFLALCLVLWERPPLIFRWEVHPSRVVSAAFAFRRPRRFAHRRWSPDRRRRREPRQRPPRNRRTQSRAQVLGAAPECDPRLRRAVHRRSLS